MIVTSEMFKHQEEKRASFNRLAQIVFGIDFESWYQSGYWDETYCCYSLFQENQMIANVSASVMEMAMDGQRKHAIQIGTVMTHPEHRNKGYAKQLLQHVLNRYEDHCDFIFLFANRSAVEFYPKFGFKPLEEHRFLLRVHVESGPYPLRQLKLTCEEDRAIIDRMLTARIPVSRRFGLISGRGLFYFYAQNLYEERLHYSSEDEAVIIFEHAGNCLELYDVLSDKDIDLEGIIRRTSNEKTRLVRIHFTPDTLLEHAVAVPFGENDDVMFVKPLNEHLRLSPFCVPKLAHA